jgi:hypothetical protein
MNQSLFTQEEIAYLRSKLVDIREDEPLLVDVPNGVLASSTTVVISYRSGISPKEGEIIDGFFKKFPRWKKALQSKNNLGHPLIQMTLFFCPKCGSVDVKAIGSLSNVGGSMGLRGEYTKPTLRDFECNECKEIFNYS